MTDPTDAGATRGAGTSSDTRPATATTTRLGDGADAPDVLVGRVLAERYRIEKLLGSGGMGSVYRAQHVHMRKSVAIKVLHREMTFLPEIVARFEREAVAAARIEHPNVAAATDFGRLEDGSFYLVLEYVEGRNLRELIKEHKRLQTPHALHITRQIAAALAAAHGSGIVHRDLKPDNVMLIRREGDIELVKVLDFGIAKLNVGEVQEQPLTQLGTVFGTPEYMSPEQAQGLAVDARADLYTLGILLYEMLAGKTPFNDDDLIVVLTRQLTMDPPPLPADVDARVSSLAIQLLQKTPEVRIQTAAEVVHQIDAILGGSLTPSPVSASAYAPQSVNVGVPSSMAQSAGFRRPIAKTEPMEAVPDAIPSSGVVGAQTGVEFSETVLSLQRPDLYGAPPSSMLAHHPVPAAGVTMVERARLAFAETLPRLGRQLPDLKRTVNIGGQPIPLWAIVIAGGVLLLTGIWLLVAALSDESELAPTLPGATAPSKPVLPPADPGLGLLIEKAQTGDRASLSELLVRPESRRSAAEWRAIARGQSRLGQYAASLVSYRRALALAPALASDAQLLRDVRDAAERPDAGQAALGLAATLGAGGADLLWDVWDAHKKDPKNSALAKSARQYLDSLRAKASPALGIALDLTNAKKCPEVKELMPRALQYADERSVSRLKSLKQTRGCGFLGFADCFSCLRRDKSVSDALTAAQDRPAPRFGAAPSVD